MAGEFTKQIKTGLDANNTSTVTTGLDVRENKVVSWCLEHKTGSRTSYVFTLQCSLDNINWSNTGSTIIAGAGAFALVDNINIATQYVRLKCTTAEGLASTVDIIINAK